MCWTEEEGPGLCCAGKGQALRGANGFPTSSLLNSVLAVLPACLFSSVLHPFCAIHGKKRQWQLTVGKKRDIWDGGLRSVGPWEGSN